MQNNGAAGKTTKNVPLWIFLFLLAAMVSCGVSPELQQCDNISCPSSTRCHISSAGQAACIEPELSQLCSDAVNGSECSYRGSRGLCDNNACILSRCGNGALEPGEECDQQLFASASCVSNGYTDGSLVCDEFCQISFEDCHGKCGDNIREPAYDEVCDDGNVFSADGCSFDCKSLEICGNGIVDAIVSEVCDDVGSRGLAGDGCDNKCQQESYQWSSPAALIAPVRAATCWETGGTCRRYRISSAQRLPGIAASTNAVTKVVLSFTSGPRAYARRVSVGVVLVMAAAWAGYVATSPLARA